ncbi:MAG: hypothetical protein PHH49_08705, partial [Candidatus Omnitrophica bacterium]|nr:hypothetical protein [Candidatus Omnitrophota bacterium]
DSVQKTGIRAYEVNGEILLPTLPGGKPMNLYFLLKRYLAEHAPPQAIFLYIDPFTPEDSSLVVLRYFTSIPEFLDMWPDLTWRERKVFISRYWASLDLRKVGLTQRRKYPYSNKKLVDDMVSHNGYIEAPEAEGEIPADYFSEHVERFQFRTDIRQVDLKYLDKFMRLAAANGIDVVFMGMVVPEGLNAVLEDLGFNADYIGFYDGLKSEYPKAYFLSEPILTLENRYFCDSTHLNTRGSELYTEYFKNDIFQPYLDIMRDKESGEHEE